MELVNGIRKSIESGTATSDPAVREGVEALAILLSLFAPYTAEDMWNILGHEPTVMLAGWPTIDDSLLVEDTVTCVVQVLGKVRDRIEVPADINESDLIELALATDGVKRHLEGKSIKSVIARVPKLVNIVTN
jgi:leucyl-tRNA synthetase